MGCRVNKFKYHWGYRDTRFLEKVILFLKCTDFKKAYTSESKLLANNTDQA